MVPRKRLAYQLLEWVGDDRLTMVDPGRGWPSYLDCKTRTGVTRIAAYLGDIGDSHRNRPDERRFQNPGQDHPVHEPEGDEIPMMLGATTEVKKQPILVGMDAHKRIGALTRYSLFMPIQLVEAAVKDGWHEHMSTAEERLIAFTPRLLPLFVDVYRSKRAVTAKEIAAMLRTARD